MDNGEHFGPARADHRASRSVVLAGTAALALTAAACTADIGHLDGPRLGLAGPDASSDAGGSGGSMSLGSGGALPGPTPAASSSARVAGLPDIPRPRFDDDGKNAPREGRAIEVQPGDTLFAIARRHGTTVADLKTLNGLTSNDLKPGQRILVSRGGETAAGPDKPPRGKTKAEVRSPPTTHPGDGSYVVRRGESLSKIARDHRVRVAELQALNGIVNVRSVKPGTVLKIPKSASAPAPSGTRPAKAEPEPRDTTPAPAPPTILNARRPTPSASDTTGAIATRSDTANDAVVAPVERTSPAKGPTTVETSKLRWPVHGRVIAAFGPRPDGTRNDGINVSVPLGTEVHAAEAGTVAYAGDELKGYGNLVLVKHGNGWVTAYAHNDQLLVKKGDRVARGQVLAKAGKSGQVDQPQLHFELRQDSKPVDPAPFLE